jgi:uncharacterized protein (UPF0276 family)
MRRLIGIGYRHHWATWVDTRPGEIGCLEITAEHFFNSGEDRLRALSRTYPSFVHGLGLSLGTPGRLDDATMDKFVRVVQIADPLWISEHVAFTRTEEVDLGHLNPISPNAEALAVMVEHAVELSKRCGKPLILENITSHLRLDGDMSETQFLNELCDKAQCGLLLDVTNLYINSRNHGFDARAWVRELDPSRIVQLHLVGYGFRDGRWHDDHSSPIQGDLLDLARDVVEYAPARAVIVERDSSFPPAEEMASELRMLEECLGAN